MISQHEFKGLNSSTKNPLSLNKEGSLGDMGEGGNMGDLVRIVNCISYLKP